jgi:hypothetical protein
VTNDETKGELPFAPLSVALANVPPEPPWTWDGYLAPGTITLLAGRPKVGKSTLLFGLFEALLSGQPFLERTTRAQGVLLLSEEREGTLAEKARLFGLDGRLHLLMRHQANGVPWPEIMAMATSYCLAHELSVLAIDTWDKWTGLRGDAENNAGSVIEALEPLVQAAGAGLALPVLAHQRKSLGDFGEAVRGSNALTGGVDVVVELERPRSDVLAGDGVRVLNAISRYASRPTPSGPRCSRRSRRSEKRPPSNSPKRRESTRARSSNMGTACTRRSWSTAMAKADEVALSCFVISSQDYVTNRIARLAMASSSGDDSTSERQT